MSIKEQERIYAEEAIKLLKEDWTLVDIPEPLDFGVRSKNFEFGLEITQVYDGGKKSDTSPIKKISDGSLMKKNESKNSRLIDALAKRYYEIGGCPIKVYVLGVLSSERIEQIADQLMFDSALLLEGQRTSFCANKVKVYVTRLPLHFDHYSRWTMVDDHVGWVRQVTSGDLQAVINKKRENLVYYKKKYSDVDLLLVADRTFNSGRLILPECITIENPGFRSVYFLSYPESIDCLLTNHSSVE